MATTLAVAGNVDFNGDLDVDGTTNLDVVDIDGAVDMATTLAVAGNVDFNGDLDVDGTSNLDVVDIDGAVDMASTLAVGGVLTANAGVVFNEDSADVDFRVESNNSANMLFVDGGNDEVVIQRASSGATATAGSVLIVEDDDNAEISILGGSSSVLALNFGHSGDADDAKIDYNTTSGSEEMRIFVNAAERMSIDKDGKVVLSATAIAKTDTDTSNSGSVTLDFGANQNFVLTMTGNVTLANPSTEQVGQSGFIACIQDGTGSRTLSLGTDYETAGGAGITLTTTASATDLIPYVVIAANRILLGTPQLAFS
jgi:prepilin-type processing-associated H-X9-DG protein